MKKKVVPPSILIASLALAISAQSQTAAPHTFRFLRQQADSQTGRGLTRPFLSLPPALSSGINWVQCPPEAQTLGAMCGQIPVPLDRQHPEREKIKIYFEIYQHTKPGPAESAILPNTGGPGVATTWSVLRATFLVLFAPNLDVHDLVLVDDRGRGLSGSIDCGELQHGIAPFRDAETDCAAKLGNADSRYGTGDVAMDIEAVRAALGYDMVDYWGASYGGEDVTAYATRFGQHLRSIVLDAPEGTPALRAFLLDGNEARSTDRAVRLDCERSPTCFPDHPDPDDQFARLIQAIANKPVWGWAHDASGNLVPVTLDEAALLYLAINQTGSFYIVSTGELLAAGDSLSRGDAAPLLRLGAEVTPLVTDYGAPTIYSQGDYFATMCVDADEPWDWFASLSDRRMQLADAVSELHSDHFAPFSNAAGTSLEVSFEHQCLWWQKPTSSSPVTPEHPIYPNVPTLVLDGDIDTIVPMEEVQQVAALFPGSTFVPVAESPHVTAYWTQCAANIESQFLETLQVGDTSCAQTPETVWPAMGRFPLFARDARAAEIDPSGKNQIDLAERGVVTVAVATVTDALKRASIGSGNGVGLRAGTFQSTVDANGNQTTVLTNCAFAKDVTVSGSVRWGADKSFAADLTVSGSGTAGGNLHVEGTWEAPGPVGNFRVSGMLGGDAVAVVVPEA